LHVGISYLDCIENQLRRKKDRVALAKEVTKEFIDNRLAERSFSVNTEKKLISPHQYIAARRYLEHQVNGG
jgi:hypothetical protein